METTEEFSILTIKNATLEDAGNYKITAENVVGKAEADFEVVVKGQYLGFFKTETGNDILDSYEVKLVIFYNLLLEYFLRKISMK